MGRKPKPRISDKELTKGELRKLNALRKSLGDDIAEKAFAEWYASAGTDGVAADKNADLVADTLSSLAQAGKLRIPRGGYLVRRGRGRVIVERPDYE